MSRLSTCWPPNGRAGPGRWTSGCPRDRDRRHVIEIVAAVERVRASHARVPEPRRLRRGDRRGAAADRGGEHQHGGHGRGHPTRPDHRKTQAGHELPRVPDHLRRLPARAGPARSATTWANDPTEGGRWWLFPLAVKGFFDNGGQRLYVKRVVSSEAEPAAGEFGEGLVSQIVRDAAAGATTLELSHLIGFTGRDPITIFRGDDRRGDRHRDDHRATTPPPAGSRSTPDCEAAVKAVPRRLRPGRPARGRRPSLRFTASSPGSWGSGRPGAGPARWSSATLPVLPDPAQGELFVTQLAEDADATTARRSR